MTERHVLALGLGASGIFVAAAVATALWAMASGGSTWAPLHLALAGAATVAIGTFMPHFAVTLAGVMPSSAPARLTSLGLLAIGSALTVVGVTLLGRPWPLVGMLFVLGGLAIVAAHVMAPTRQPLSRRHPIVTAAYVAALAELAAGVVIGGLGSMGVPAILANWALLRPAHAWLTLFGAVSLTITATLVYLAPTVLGARIRASWALAASIAGIGLGPILTAVAFALDSRTGVLGGMGLTLIGAIGQLAYGLDCLRRRGRFTSEHDWRGVAIGHLLGGPAWMLVAVGIALADILLGRPLAGWSLGLLALPMVAGWMLQELVGSWTHLAPSVTPGGPLVHARQRRILATAGRTRLVAWNAGLATLSIGVFGEMAVLAVAGGLALGAAVVVSLVLLLRSLALGPYGWVEASTLSDGASEADASAEGSADPLAFAVPLASGEGVAEIVGGGVGSGSKREGTSSTASTMTSTKMANTASTHGAASRSWRGRSAPR